MELHLSPASYRVSLLMIEEAGISYTLGPLDESILTEEWRHAPEIGPFRLLVPGGCLLPESLRGQAEFGEGAAWGYQRGWDEQTYTPLQLVNRLAHDFQRSLYDGGSYAWVVGFSLGWLSSIAERDWLIALVGIAHLCFLLSLVPDTAGLAFEQALRQVECLHRAVLHIYRAEVRALREQGVSSAEAWQLALRPQRQAV